MILKNTRMSLRDVADIKPVISDIGLTCEIRLPDNDF